MATNLYPLSEYSIGNKFLAAVSANFDISPLVITARDSTIKAAARAAFASGPTAVAAYLAYAGKFGTKMARPGGIIAVIIAAFAATLVIANIVGRLFKYVENRNQKAETEALRVKQEALEKTEATRFVASFEKAVGHLQLTPAQLATIFSAQNKDASKVLNVDETLNPPPVASASLSRSSASSASHVVLAGNQTPLNDLLGDFRKLSFSIRGVIVDLLTAEAAKPPAASADGKKVVDDKSSERNKKDE